MIDSGKFMVCKKWYGPPLSTCQVWWESVSTGSGTISIQGSGASALSTHKFFDTSYKRYDTQAFAWQMSGKLSPARPRPQPWPSFF